MNIFYTPPSNIHSDFAELTGQEAKHASKVMRVREGDSLTVVDGKGGWYEGIIGKITNKTIRIEIENEKKVPAHKPELILGMGIIKKRDRLEFAVEKAVELGASEICLFRGEHTIKQNVRMDRLEAVVLSAMKQSLRARLPKIMLFQSFKELLEEHKNVLYLAAHEKTDPAKAGIDLKAISDKKVLLLVGPEGGFSNNEIQLVIEKGGELISLGAHRLRAETATIAFLSRFIG